VRADRIEEGAAVAAIPDTEGAAPAGRTGNAPDLRRVGLHPSFWYPLARSGDVQVGKTHLATFAGDPIALARTERGEVFALEDRCAHRQFPLHKGVVTGDNLKCAYHGWTYAKDGRLAGVPYLPRHACRPDGVRAYPCREQDGYVFVFTGSQAEAASVPLPTLPAPGSRRHRVMHFWRQVRCHYSFMHENLMDMNHQFLHRGLMGLIKPTLLDHQAGANWVEARYLFQRASGKPDRGARFMLSGHDSDAAAPRGDVMTIRTQYPFQTLSVCRRGASTPSFDMWAAYVPFDREQRTHVSVGVLAIEKPRLPGLIHVMWPFIRRFTESVFAEDRMAVEAEQRAYDEQQADWNQEINPVILAVREVLLRNGVPLMGAG
jgi:phenylpropionate dioxygenase-like ring-hydroxylating dioxygenase large terminal subunit